MDDMRLSNEVDECRTLQGVLILAFCAIALLLIRFQAEQPWELLGMIVSVISVGCVLYAYPTETFGILILILILSYFLISISNDIGTGIQIFMSTFILAILLYMFIETVTKTSISYLLIFAIIIDAIYLYRLLTDTIHS